MERGKGKEGKGKEAAVEETQLAASSAGGAAPDLSSAWGQRTVAAPASKKRAHETEAQKRRRKKKNRKNRERQERKAAGEKINSPDDVPTFDESDSADPSEVNFSADPDDMQECLARSQACTKSVDLANLYAVNLL
jgi:hypothetical protein